MTNFNHFNRYSHFHTSNQKFEVDKIIPSNDQVRKMPDKDKIEISKHEFEDILSELSYLVEDAHNENAEFVAERIEDLRVELLRLIP